MKYTEHDRCAFKEFLRDNNLTKDNLGLVHTLAIVRVYHVDDAVRLLVIFVPQRLQLLLAAQIPEIKTHALHIDGADVEADRCRDLAGVQALVVPRKLGLGGLQVGLRRHIQYTGRFWMRSEAERFEDVFKLENSWVQLPFCPHCPGPESQRSSHPSV